MPNSENDTILQELNFNDAHLNSPVTRACTKLINFKNAVQWHSPFLKVRRKAKNMLVKTTFFDV
jgi:hypothetical protein